MRNKVVGVTLYTSSQKPSTYFANLRTSTVAIFVPEPIRKHQKH